MPDELHVRTAVNRKVIAGMFASLDEDQLGTPSLCAGWTCRDVLGHLVMCIDLRLPGFLLEVARDRGRAGATSDRLARAYAARPLPELVATLRDRSTHAVSQPGVGAHGPFADSCIHMRDVAIPLDLPTTPPLEDWVEVLDFLGTRRARGAGFLPRGRLDGLALRADDHHWTAGDGAPVTGRSEALAMSLTGRAALLGELTGTGAATLRRRVLASQQP